MKGYKDGSYGGAMKGLMKGQVAALSDADIEAIAQKIGK
jgi:cytochrome c553